MKTTVTICVILSGMSLCAQGQDPVFSQFYTSSLYLNPALVGVEKDVTIGMNYRSQWTGVNLPFRTFQLSAIHPIVQRGIHDKLLGGFGATLFSDEAGSHREMVSQGFSIASGYNFHLNRHGTHLIAAGLQFGVLQRQLNMDALQWSSQYAMLMGYDPSLPGEQLASERVTSPVIHAGIMWRLVEENRLRPARAFYQGLGVSNINRPDGFFLDRKDKPAILYKLPGGMLQSFNNGFELSPNYLIQYQKKTQINVGAYVAYRLQSVTGRFADDFKVSLGLWHRIEDSFITTIGFSCASWTAGFSYDANNSALERNFNGANAFEISFVYRINTANTTRRFSTPLI